MVGHGGMVRALAVSPDGSRVLTGSFDYTAKLWDFVEQKEIGEFDRHLGPVNAVAFLPAGNRALSASDDRTIMLWDLATQRPVRTLNGHTNKVTAIAVSANGRVVATGGWDRTVRLWDLANGRQIHVLKHPSPVNAVAFVADGILVSGAHDGVLRLWDTVAGRPQGKMVGHEMGITQIAVSPDGTRILSASIDKTLRLWDWRRRRELRAFSKHEGQVLAVAFSPDGKTALSAGRDGYMIQWDLARGRPIRSVRAHERRVWAVAYSPDGRFGLSASSDEVVRVWHLQTGDRIGLEGEGTSEPKPWLTSDHPGAKLFRKCAACHSLIADGARRSGPHFANLFGRRAGSVAGYNYSNALKDVDFVWTGKTLSQLFLQGPDVFLPGTKMPLQRIGDEKSLTDLVNYLRQVTAANAAKTAE